MKKAMGSTLPFFPAVPGISIIYEAITDEIPADLTVEQAISDANIKTTELNLSQERVDLLLSLLQEKDPALYSKLVTQRNEARGFFNEYIVPAYNYLMEMLGIQESAKPQSTMGLLPLIPVAAISVGAIASTAAIIAAVAFYKEADHAIEKENAILDDPNIPEDVKRKVLLSGGTLWDRIESLSSTVKWTVGATVLGVLGYQAAKIVRQFGR